MLRTEGNTPGLRSNARAKRSAAVYSVRSREVESVSPALNPEDDIIDSGFLAPAGLVITSKHSAGPVRSFRMAYEAGPDGIAFDQKMAEDFAGALEKLQTLTENLEQITG